MQLLKNSFNKTNNFSAQVIASIPSYLLNTLKKKSHLVKYRSMLNMTPMEKACQGPSFLFLPDFGSNRYPKIFDQKTKTNPNPEKVMLFCFYLWQVFQLRSNLGSLSRSFSSNASPPFLRATLCHYLLASCPSYALVTPSTTFQSLKQG